jgi:alcohol dehydrogenase
VGISAGGTELPMPQLLFKNVSLWTGLGHLGSIDTLLDLVARGVIDPTPMITHRTTLAEIGTAFERFSDPTNGVIKYAITV